MKREELTRLEKFLRRTFKSQALSLKAVPKKDDMAELYMGEDFLGPVYRVIDEDNELSYEFRMAILELDLEDA